MANEDFRIGIGRLDDEHERFRRMIDDLRHAQEAGQPADATVKAVEELDWYISEHFAYEEQLMEEHAFPAIEGHRREHIRFRAQIETLRQEVECGQTEILSVLINLLERWFLRHVHGPDRALGEYLKAHGVT